MMKHASANPSTAQTNAALVALAAGRTVVLKGVYLSSDTQMVLTLVNSVTHDVIWRQYCGADGGLLVGGTNDHELARCTFSEGIDYTTSTNGNVFVKVMYDFADGLP